MCALNFYAHLVPIQKLLLVPLSGNGYLYVETQQTQKSIFKKAMNGNPLDMCVHTWARVCVRVCAC